MLIESGTGKDTAFYDQMILYTANRKSKKLRSKQLRLTDLARNEIKNEKLDYSEEWNWESKN